jgi:hypothetical protein
MALSLPFLLSYHDADPQQFNADPAFHFNADPASNKNNADPDPRNFANQKRKLSGYW